MTLFCRDFEVSRITDDLTVQKQRERAAVSAEAAASIDEVIIILIR
ncbi:MAG: hypothetical protein MnENMB40S_38350 [Rhizobiaceae bacterium MnEN-MB40S]|nr:MAG: hypothetical protein MnENMB40S_38350 [Rhizobiaceae bacterium MnEN-MB40S]